MTRIDLGSAAPAPPIPPPPTLGWRIVLGAGAAVALGGYGLGALTASVEPVVGWGIVGGLAALLLTAAAAYRPVIAIYVYLATLPFVAGIDRNNLIPLVRPNEAVLALVLVGALIGAYVRCCRGAARPPALTRLDLALAAFTLLSTAWPLASLLIRGLTPTPLELASVLPVCKLVAVYLLVRLTVATDRAIVTVIRLIVWSGTLIAMIAVMQTLDVAPVIRVLHTIYLPDVAVEEIAERGTTTLASPIATGDFIIIALILVICCSARGVIRAWEGRVLGTVLGTGVLAAGQFSTWIAAVVAGALLLWRFPRLRRRFTRITPLVAVALIVGAPALIARLEGFSELGLPVSWLGRWDNLSNFYLPRFDFLHIVLGVSTNPVLQAPETWRSVIYLEAGYLYFLWIGGLPLLAAFVWLSVVVLRTARAVRLRPGVRGACGAALEIVWWFLLVLTVLDPHLTLRGTGDLIFVLLGIVVATSTDHGVAALDETGHRRAVDLDGWNAGPHPVVDHRDTR